MTANPASSEAASNSAFPDDFLWGVATSSYQIEGACKSDGRGESIWDRFSHTPGKVYRNQTGDRAVDHYHRWPEDLQLMADLGINAYRFSMAWPRVFPDGSGSVNQAGLDFYSHLIDGLLERGIQPFPTLYHWDLPQSLQDQGGWPSRITAEAFAEYALIVARQLGDRVTNWITINEPYVSAVQGYLSGTHAPGIRDTDQMLAASHHLLLAHGMAVQAIRAEDPGSRVGISLNLIPYTPASDSQADRQEARLRDGMVNRWYLEPLAGRDLPADVIEQFGYRPESGMPGDKALIAEPIDFLGINYYMREVVRSQSVSEEHNDPRTRHPTDEKTAMGWEVYPQGLVDILTRVAEEYDFPSLYITENGAAYQDPASPDGGVHDPERTSYLERHVGAMIKALKLGAPLDGYFLWTLLDNFEWAHGYSKRFGIVHVEWETLKRTPKSSYEWYRSVIRANGLPARLST